MKIDSDCTNLLLIEEEEEAVETSINGSDDLRSVQEMEEDQENRLNITASKRKVTKSVNKGFNLRKSLAWNPAFFTEEGVLDPAELSYINGSSSKPNGFQKTGDRPVLNEVVQNSSCEKSNQNSQVRAHNGRKLFCTPESSKRSSRNLNSVGAMNKRLPRSPITNSQKRVANASATGHIPKFPKFTAGNGNITPTTKNSNISRNTLTIKKEQSNIKKAVPLPPKPSNKIISNTVSKPPLKPLSSSSLLNVDKNGNSNEFVGPTARILMKPSALRMPSPSFGFFSRGKVSAQPNNNSQNNTDKTLISSSKPPKPKPVNNSRLPVIPLPAAKCQAPIGRIPTKPIMASTISKIQIGPKSNIQQTPKFNRLARNNSLKKDKEECLLRVLELKDETCSNDKTTVCEEAKEDSVETLTESKPNTDENQSENSNKEEKFTNQIPCNLDSFEKCSSMEKRKSKRKSSVYGLSPLKNKRDKTVFSPCKIKPLDEKSKAETQKDLKSEATMSIEQSKKADCLAKFRKDLVPFSDEWLAALETFGEEILEKKTGPVQHSPPDKTAPEPSPWSPVKRKVQDIGPYDCTKYSKTISSPDPQ